ncbi:MAG: DUF1476 family protein [Alphaproteobacteria bacterium]|nr:DUF1476 family protein [Alphaproteobacteria bacterium]
MSARGTPTARVLARRDKLLGLWAAEHMGLGGEEAARYAIGIVEAGLARGDDAALVAMLCHDLVARGFPIVERDIRRQLDTFTAQAHLELRHDTGR